MYSAGTQADSGSRILAVRLGAMGDIIHTLPAVASLKTGFPGSRLTWAVEAKWAPLLAGNPFVDRVIEIRRGSPAALVESVRAVRAEPFDLVVDFQGLIKSALVAAAARTERIFGFDRSQAREKAATLFYSDKIASQAAHVVDRYLDLALAAGAASIVHRFPLPPGRAEGELPEGPFVLASPMAGWRSKQWPLEYYGQVARNLRIEVGIPLVVDLPPQAAAMPNLENAVVRRTGIAGLIDATRRAAAVIGVDSGPLHMAAAMEKPGVAIYGPTDPARNGPYGGTLTVLRSPRAVTSYKREAAIDPSMRDITPDQVLEALKLHLDRPHGCLA